MADTDDDIASLPLRRYTKSSKKGNKGSLRNAKRVGRKASAGRIAMLVRILTYEIESTYTDYGKPRKYDRHNIPSAINGAAYTVLYKIVGVLDDLLIEHDVSMPLEVIARDYFKSVYDYYSRFRRKPYLNQLSPTVDNVVRFEEWIEKWELESADSYWVDIGNNLDDIKATAKKLLSRPEVPDIVEDDSTIGIDEIGKGR